MKLRTARRHIITGDAPLFCRDSSDVVQHGPLANSAKGLGAVAGRKDTWHVRFHIGINRNAAGKAYLNARFARQFHIRYNTCVEQCHVRRVDSQSTGRFDANHAVVGADKREHLRANGKTDAESLKFVFDDLRHVTIQPG